MASNKVPTSLKNSHYAGKQSFLPPRSPYLSQSYTDYASSSMEPKGIPKPRGHRPRQRTPSESFLLDEQPSWLDDLLNEPESPMMRGSHRRSSSDSFAYLEASSNCSDAEIVKEEQRFKSATFGPSWGTSDVDGFSDGHIASFYLDDSSRGHHNKSSLASSTQPINCSFARDGVTIQSSRSICTQGERDKGLSAAVEKPDQRESGPQDVKDSLERWDSFTTESDQKRVKQKFAQRSRVRKLQYIAELERHVQSLEAEGSGISAELDFLGQQHFVLSMQNKALKQRLDSLEQEQVIKCMEHEILEREIARLRALLFQHHQQLVHPEQHPQQPLHSSHHRRSGSRELESQFANLSLRNKEAGSSDKPLSGSLGI